MKKIIPTIVICLIAILGGIAVGMQIQKKPIIVEQVAETKEQRAKRDQIAEKEYNAARDKWLAENPPVEKLFDADRIYDNAYVIEYLQKNKIGGHCALVYRQDVVCANGDQLAFPTMRETQYRD